MVSWSLALTRMCQQLYSSWLTLCPRKLCKAREIEKQLALSAKSSALYSLVSSRSIPACDKQFSMMNWQVVLLRICYLHSVSRFRGMKKQFGKTQVSELLQFKERRKLRGPRFPELPLPHLFSSMASTKQGSNARQAGELATG